ncbi:pyridoxamine 5'-phosphate oxidase family protein, partial [Klebsiella pneumoniae]|uniref:pyridoxamine 5'-phosphate oxidase family protein n=1 Tax=Klebsiella pneumoniae TaxID=573 RepID=UPI003F7A90BE
MPANRCTSRWLPRPPAPGRCSPCQRIVLLKHYDEKGLVFYTNLGSRKAHQIENNPQVSLLFPW